ncbi:MAG: DUF4870 domain-containing protein [bacterium]
MFLVISLFLVIGLLAFALVISVVAAVRASEGGPFQYPITIRFIQ